MPPFLRKLALFFLLLLIGLAGLFLLFFKPASPPVSPYREQAYYQSTVRRLDSGLTNQKVAYDSVLYTGWAKQNITPSEPTKLMGYGWKGNFERVRDSLAVRSIVFQQGELSVAFISYDLMLVPPTVAQGVREQLAALGLPNVYFTAIHTHHGFGEWQTGPAGTFITGGYDPGLVDALVAKTVNSVRQARRQRQPTTLRYARYHRPELVNNRLVRGGPTEAYLRAVWLEQASGATAVISSFSAHATLLSSKTKELSADYPGAVVRRLEEQPAIDFALFAAGAVGSHSPAGGEGGTPDTYAGALTEPLVATAGTPIDPHPMRFAEVPISLGEPQLRLFAGWQVRPWLFRWFFGEIHPSLSVFRLGKLVFVGLPADFSGMLYPAIQSGDWEVMVTSFNGDYIGYVIPDAYYDLPHREARETNWYGPQTGSYVVDLINRVLRRMQEDAPKRADEDRVLVPY